MISRSPDRRRGGAERASVFFPSGLPTQDQSTDIPTPSQDERGSPQVDYGRQGKERERWRGVGAEGRRVRDEHPGPTPRAVMSGKAEYWGLSRTPSKGQSLNTQLWRNTSGASS